MKLERKISVIIPCYNIEKYISICLESFLRQTLQDFEIICVDDGSTDKTAEIIENYSYINNKIKLIRQTNQYAGVARNNGLKNAKGKYVLFFDGDDFCDENMFTEMVASAEKHNSDIVVCDVQTYDDQTGKYDRSVPFFRESLVRDYKDVGIVSYHDIPDNILLLASSGPWNKLYRKSFIVQQELEFQASKRDNDEYFVLMSMALAEKISWVPKKFVTYRVNNPNSLQGFGEENIDTVDMLSTVQELRNGLIKKGRYELVKKSFQNQVLVRYVGLIEAQRSWENYKKIFDFTKNYVFTEFEINQMRSDEVFMRAEERKKILESNAEEYLFWQMRKMKYGHGERYIFPYREIVGAKTIGLYGAGMVGQAYYRQIKEVSSISLSGWYDKNYDFIANKDYSIQSPDQIAPEKMDRIVIAVESGDVAKIIKQMLLNKGFEEKNIIWSI